jgi:hypothetical protein
LLKFALEVLPVSWHRGTALKSHLLSFLAFQPALTVVEYAWLAAARLVNSPNGQSHLASALLIDDSIKIISDRAGDQSSIQSDDWHDMTGHHRYYGGAVSLRSPFLPASVNRRN